MTLSRSLILSIILTLVFTLLLRLIFGTMAFGLFLFLPLSFLFAHNRTARGQRPETRDRTIAPDSRPIEPK